MYIVYCILYSLIEYQTFVGTDVVISDSIKERNT